MMTGWIFQGGHPIVTTETTPHGLKVSQHHFTLDPGAADDRQWAVPLRVAGRGSEHNVLLATESLTLTGVVDPVITANSSGSGFFRSRIDPLLIDRITATGLSGRKPGRTPYHRR